MDAPEQGKREQGFTLIELLITIVVMGILAAVSIVGIGGLANTGSNSACTASLSSVTEASTAYYANRGDTWPATMQALATATPSVFSPPVGAVFAGAGPSTMKVATWTLTQTGGGGTRPTYSCS